MSEKQLSVSIPLDASGFLRQECPYCAREFKLEYPEDDSEDNNPSEQYCPYCGQSGPSDEFLTKAQAKYVDAIVQAEAVDPLLDQYFPDQENSTRHSTSKPTPPEDDDDMVIIIFSCCSERIKVESPSGRFHCLKCGKAGDF